MVSHYRFTNQKTCFCTVCYGGTLHCSQTTRQVSVQFVMVSHYLFTNQKIGFCTVCYGFTLPVYKPKDRFLYSLLWFHTTGSQTKRQVSVQFFMVSHYLFTNQKIGFCTVCYGFTLPVYKPKDKFLYSLLWFHITGSQTKRHVSVQFVMVTHYPFTNQKTGFCTVCYGFTLPVHKPKGRFLYSLLWILNLTLYSIITPLNNDVFQNIMENGAFAPLQQILHFP